MPRLFTAMETSFPVFFFPFFPRHDVTNSSANPNKYNNYVYSLVGRERERHVVVLHGLLIAITIATDDDKYAIVIIVTIFFVQMSNNIQYYTLQVRC